MATDAYDVWDELYGIMCIPCPHRKWCHDGLDESDANDAQMIECMCRGQIVRNVNQIVTKDEIFDPLGAEVENVDRDVTGDR